jgi:hypothetical protein
VIERLLILCYVRLITGSSEARRLMALPAIVKRIFEKNGNAAEIDTQ